MRSGSFPPSCAIRSDIARYSSYASVAAANASSSEAKTGSVVDSGGGTTSGSCKTHPLNSTAAARETAASDRAERMSTTVEHGEGAASGFSTGDRLRQAQRVSTSSTSENPG